MKVQPALTDTELRLFLKERFQNCHQTNLTLSPSETLSDLPPQARNWFGENPANYVTYYSIYLSQHKQWHTHLRGQMYNFKMSDYDECLKGWMTVLRFSPCSPPRAGLSCGSLDTGPGQTRHIVRNTWSQSDNLGQSQLFITNLHDSQSPQGSQV